MKALSAALGFLALLLFATASPTSAAPLPGFTVTGAASFEHTSLTVEGTIVVADGGTLTLTASVFDAAGNATPASGPSVTADGAGNIILALDAVPATAADAAVKIGTYP